MDLFPKLVRIQVCDAALTLMLVKDKIAVCILGILGNHVCG